jgi:hypothetical protein
MGDLRNKAKKLEAEQSTKDAQDRRENGWTVFYFNFDPRLTRRNLSLGEAIRYLCRVTGRRISWWRCEFRGLAIKYHELPRTKYAYDSGQQYMSLVFSNLEDQVEAKKLLVQDALLTGIEHYRGLPNSRFDSEVETLCWLLKAPPSVSAEEWIQVKKRLQRQSQSVLWSHEANLRMNLLGEKINGPGDLHRLTATARLKAVDKRG